MRQGWLLQPVFSCSQQLTAQCGLPAAGVHRSLGVHNSKVRSCNLVSACLGVRRLPGAAKAFGCTLPFPLSAASMLLWVLHVAYKPSCLPHALLPQWLCAVQDTWLPEQVAFVSAMGNARANAYWEVGAGSS